MTHRMYQPHNTSISQLEFAREKFLANASIFASQTEVGIVTKQLNGYTAIMLEYLDFAFSEDIDNEAVEATLSYVLT